MFTDNSKARGTKKKPKIKQNKKKIETKLYKECNFFLCVCIQMKQDSELFCEWKSLGTGNRGWGEEGGKQKGKPHFLPPPKTKQNLHFSMQKIRKLKSHSLSGSTKSLYVRTDILGSL